MGDFENRFFDPIIKRGSSSTGKFRDYTVKVDVTGVDQGSAISIDLATTANSHLPVQQNLPENPKDEYRICFLQYYEWGYFNAYELWPETSLDLVVHLGDYIYEYG